METIPTSPHEHPSPLRQTALLEQPAQPEATPASFGPNSTLVLAITGSEKTFAIQPQKHGNMIVIGREDDSRPGLINIDLCGHTGGQFGVSRQHLMITYSPDMQLLTVMDLNSTNGSWVNNQRLYVGMSRVVRHGDVLRVGKMTLVVTLLDAVSDMDLV